MPFSLTEDSKRYLIDLVRESIKTKFQGKNVPQTAPSDPDLSMPLGAFVTLKKSGMLRGCIGRMESPQPLWLTVATMARASAFEDPRFPPMAEEELEGATIEISVLTPFESLEDPESLEVGRHGLMIEKGFNRGVLLPQVAVEQGWDAGEFLAQICIKAGLPRGAWKEPDARLFVFSAFIIDE